ncbi:MAG TPA: ATP-binding protein [Nevskiaceae bacterium]|nr:ATP-binding protein [Nevskiaceae bacterium]
MPPKPPSPVGAVEPWRVLIVDDDPEVHAVTRLALSDFEMDGRPLQLLIARSDEEARRVWRESADIALVLLDVVMETEHAGFDFVRFVREEMGNLHTRIVLRTGQPGQAPALEVISRYEIDDYRTKTELTFERLNVLVSAALRTYRLLREMDARRVQLEASNKELERFAYVVSHDLQSPLRAVLGFGSLLSERAGASLSPESRDFLARILSGARDMSQLIRDLLEYSRIGRAGAPMGEVNLNTVIEAACERVRAAIDQRHAQIHRGVLPSVSGNAALLTQLFANLIDNAIKFQPGEQPVVEIGAQASPSGVEVRVADRGVGIASEHLSEIFEPFRRIVQSTVTAPGTGIGLAICRRVAEVHGGNIRAESQQGQGTTMIVWLPATIGK